MPSFFLFGKKRRKTVKKARKPPAQLLRMCRKYHIKTTKKVGRKRVYKSITVLKKQLRKARKVHKKRKGTRKSRRTGFGSISDDEINPNIKYYDERYVTYNYFEALDYFKENEFKDYDGIPFNFDNLLKYDKIVIIKEMNKQLKEIKKKYPSSCRFETEYYKILFYGEDSEIGKAIIENLQTCPKIEYLKLFKGDTEKEIKEWRHLVFSKINLFMNIEQKKNNPKAYQSWVDQKIQRQTEADRMNAITAEAEAGMYAGSPSTGTGKVLKPGGIGQPPKIKHRGP